MFWHSWCSSDSLVEAQTSLGSQDLVAEGGLSSYLRIVHGEGGLSARLKWTPTPVLLTSLPSFTCYLPSPPTSFLARVQGTSYTSVQTKKATVIKGHGKRYCSKNIPLHSWSSGFASFPYGSVATRPMWVRIARGNRLPDMAGHWPRLLLDHSPRWPKLDGHNAQLSFCVADPQRFHLPVKGGDGKENKQERICRRKILSVLL